MISTFGSFSTAKLGIRSSQQGLQITGNNITNINTNGYTRQRIDQISLYHGTADRYSVSTDVRMGIGSLVTSVTQIRDPFLDIRFRNESCKVGFYDEKLSHLEEVKNILDEVTKDGIHTSIEDIRTQLQNLTKNPTAGEHDGLVQGACQKLVSLLNKYAADLNGQKQDALQGFDQNVDEVNEILTQIRDLNVEIRKSQIHGDPALQMLDNRNLLIDKLAEMTKIKVTYTEEKVSAGISVSKLTIELDAPEQDPANRPVLIDGSFANKLEIKPLNPDGTPNLSAEEYDISLGGLTNTRGDSPIVAEMKEEMQRINEQIASLDSLNKKFQGLDDQNKAWIADIGKHGWGVNDFGNNRDKKIQELEDAITKAQEELKNAKTDQQKEQARQKLQTAKNNLNTFNRLDKQNAEFKNRKDDLDKQRDNTFNALNATLQKHGLTANKTDHQDGSISVTVSGGTGNPPLRDIPLVDGNNPGAPAPQFSVNVNDKTGDFSLQLGGKDFKTVQAFGEIERQLNGLNEKLEALHDLNKKLSILDKQRTEWDNAIQNKNWPETDFTTDYTKKLDELKKQLNDARTRFENAAPNDKQTELQKLKEAQENLQTFSDLKKQYDDMETKKTAWNTEVTTQFNALTTALGAQGLQATMTPPPPTNGKPFSISINGGSLNGALQVIDSADPKTPPQKFNTTIAPNGDLNLNLGTDDFNTIPNGQFDNTAHELDSLKNGKLYGVLEADLQFLNGKGEFDTPTTSIRGIAYYQRSLDTLAQTFAETMNKLNQHPDKPDENRDLFESKDPNNKNITASNIAISKGWEDNKVHITQFTDPAAGSGDNSNIHNMISALNNTKQIFKVLDKDGNVVVDENGKDRELFTGSFESMFTHTSATLGNDMSTTATMLNNASISATERAVARDNLSTVDLNEEGISLVQYQKSFAAACRVMTTLDEMLDSLLSVKR